MKPVSKIGMDTRRYADPEATTKLTTALLLLCTGVSVGCAFLAIPDGPFSGSTSAWDRPLQIAANSAPLLLLCACIVVFFRPRLGYSLGLVAGAMALPWYIQTEISLAPFNSWIFLNYEGPVISEGGGNLTFVKLKILSAALIVISVACGSLRSLPSSWSFRGKPIRRRTWPIIAVGFITMAVWFACSVTPYSVPDFDHSARAEIRILHVQKRGLRFEETRVSELRDGRVWLLRDSRSLFQYRFEVRVAMAALGQSPAAYARVRALVQSPDLWNMRTAAPKPLRSWNAEGWYVVLKDSRLLAFTTQDGTTPPETITDLFREIEQLPASEQRNSAIRDVCLGFCYDPVAALGFTILPQRKRLLATSSFVEAGF
jgi:hypothetical protein